MKKRWKIGGTIAALTAVILVWQLFNPAAEEKKVAVADVQTRTIIASGVGEVSLEPDMAYVQLGAQVVSQTANNAQNELSKKMNSIKKVLKDFGIDDKNVRTAYFHVYPYQEMEANGEMSKVEKYRAEHALEVKFTDIKRLGELIDAASKAGSNRIDQVRFSLQNPEKAQNEALKKAIENAKEKADAMAAAAGKSRGDVLQIADQAAQVQPFYAEQAQFANEAAADAESMAIETGEINVTQRVDVIYQMN